MDIRRRTQIGGIKKTSSASRGYYSVNLNGQWEETTAVPNPDPTLYDGVYRSYGNYNISNPYGNTGAVMYIYLKDCSSFKLYIRSYAESTYDYVMVSQLDKAIYADTSYSDTTLVKSHTRGNQQSSAALSNYTLVDFTGISSGEHTITVVYKKDKYTDSGDDRGYVLIEKMEEDSGEDDVIPEPIINTDNYLTIEALENGLTAKLSTNTCEYCIDGDGNWKILPASTETESIKTGHTLSFRGELIPNSSDGIGTFAINKKCNLKGNCMSMLFGDVAANNYSLSGKNYAFYKLFYNCYTIVNVSENFLPATILSQSCYASMFYNCNILTTAPELPATTLVNSCYASMFYNCASLISAPELLATILKDYCYHSMFRGCTKLISAYDLPATTLTFRCYYYMFCDCKSLTVAPELPATTIANECYSSMFYGCTSLTTSPTVLPATILKDRCYSGMFEGCSSLTTAPVLPATTLATYCYNYMFDGCSSLTTAPELSATNLENYCYRAMFEGCSSLTTAPVLPATTLANECYKYMFWNCSSLTTAPELPATTLATDCYDYMFNGCSSLTTAPVLPATTLVDSCYYGMFWGCKKLNYIKMLATDISASNCLDSWVTNVAPAGTFVKNPAMTSLPTGSDGIPSGWAVVNNGEESIGGPINIDNYLTIEALEDGLTASLSTNECEYCVDGDGNWKSLSAGTTTQSINSGQKLSFRGGLTPDMYEGIGTFTISKKCNLKGNCMSMLFRDNAANIYSLSGKTYAFYKLFYNCTNIVNVSSNFLPATTLANYCYLYMFYGCTSLTDATELPATTLSGRCYYCMFYDCTSLTAAPQVLPATTLTSECYGYMFNGCTSLTTAPELPATTLANRCYQGMFYGCNKLNYVKMLATDISASYCLSGWLNGVASSGRFVKNPAMTSLPTGTSGIPSGWTVVNDGEESGNLITFTVDGTEYQAEEGMTFYDWTMSEYYDNSCPLTLSGSSDLRNDIINQNVSSGDSINIRYGIGLPITPIIYTDTIIQQISYIPDFSGFE